jgi:hypothetical protein
MLGQEVLDSSDFERQARHVYTEKYADHPQKATSVRYTENLKNVITVGNHNQHMGYINKGSRMVNGYSISLKT